MNATTAHTLSLSRWHIVADRLKTSIQVKQREALACIGNTQIQHAPTAVQKEALRERGKLAIQQIQEVRETLGVIGTIRSELAVKNAEVGVSALLAQIDAARQSSKLLGELCAIDLLTKMDLDEADTLFQKADSDRASMHRTYGGVAVNVVDPASLSSCRSDRADLDAEIAALTDRVNDLNRHTLTLHLPGSVARVAGLKGDATN